MAAAAGNMTGEVREGSRRCGLRHAREVHVRVLVLGGGQIARAVGAAVPGQHQVVTRTHSELDIVDESAVARTLSEVNADWVVNAAAYTAVDLAEDQPAPAHAVNDTAVASLTRVSPQEGRW